MSKIDRVNGNYKAFASEQLTNERTTFGTEVVSNDLTAQQTPEYLRGMGTIGPTQYPTLQDFNAVHYSSTQSIAYLHQMGVPEWSEDQEYPTDGATCIYNGVQWFRKSTWTLGDKPGVSSSWTPAPATLQSVFDPEFANLVEGQAVELIGYHPDTTVGGSSGVVKLARHNGGTAISLSRARPTDWNDQAQLTAWFADSAQNELCFVRLYDGDINSEWFGAFGDIATNDTSAFNAIEANFVGSTVSLNNLSFTVDSVPSNNTYINGNFIVDSKLRKTGFIQDDAAARGAVAGLVQKYEDERYPPPEGLNGINIIGDSISHGAYAGDLYRNNWPDVLKRMFSAEFGEVGYGFSPFHGLGSGSELSLPVHDITWSGSWSSIYWINGGEDVIQGLSFVSSTVGDSIEIVCPTFQKQVKVWYIADTDGGEFGVSSNGGAVYTVSTSAASRQNYKSVNSAMNDDGTGKFTLKIENISGKITICGVSYSDDDSKLVVQNFSASGRKLEPLTESAIDVLCKGKMLIMALGHNDAADSESTPEYAASFSQKIDWIIRSCLTYNTSVVVPDFCWFSEETTHVRKELKRLAQETRGIYIPFPEYLNRDGLIKGEFSSSYYLVDTLNMWQDASHPNPTGHKWIAETVAKSLGLSCTSKKDALEYHDYFYPIQIEDSSSFRNMSGQYPYLSMSKQVGNTLLINLRIKSSSVVSAGSLEELTKGRSQDRRFTQYPYTDCNTPLDVSDTTGAATIIAKEAINGTISLKFVADATVIKTSFNSTIIT